MNKVSMSLSEARKLAGELPVPPAMLDSMISDLMGMKVGDIHPNDRKSLELATGACLIIASSRKKDVVFDFSESDFVAGPAKLPLRLDYSRKLLSHLNVDHNI